MDWAQILVIILAIFLAVFLLLGIVLTALLIKVTRQIKSTTGSVERTAMHIERAVAGVSKIASPALLIRTLVKQVKKFKK